MNAGGIIGGGVAGILGAALWAAIAYFGNVEIGYLAWGIGAAVGFGVSAGSKSGGLVPAVFAILITIASLLGGKYMTVQLAVRDLDKQLHSEEFKVSDEDLVDRLAYDLAEEQTVAGKTLKWRNGKSLETMEAKEDYPKSILNEAEKKFRAISDEEKAEMKQQQQAEFEEFVKLFEGAVAQQGFVDSFSGFDIIFFLLGIATAGKIAFADYVEK